VQAIKPPGEIMKITCLLENTSIDPALTPRHGLSLFIETGETKILFDMGPDDQFLTNARALGIKPESADFGVLSHGHKDHGGGIPAFQALCPETEIFMTDRAADTYRAQMLMILNREIGLDWKVIDKNSCRFIASDTPITGEITLFKGFDTRGFMPKGNAALFKTRSDGEQEPDDFSHELALLVVENDKRVLFTGCSHSGIGNMVRAVLDRTGLSHMDIVVGGFHLFNPISRKTEPQSGMDDLADELSAFSNTRFYTGHCTGAKALNYLQAKLGEQVQPLSTGTRITP